MKKLHYICTLQAPVVISSHTATEGKHPSLDYIPGSKFLGIVAKNKYNKIPPEQALDLFHNGKVRFGDAHPYIKGERLERMPLSWQLPKGEEDGSIIYLHHLLTNEKKEQLTKEGRQLKEAKGKYFSASDQHYKIIQDFSMKSAFDGKKRRSKEGSMFAYAALQKGSTWSFTVEVEDEIYAAIIQESFAAHQGIHRLGRSKSSEYGLVQIEPISTLVAQTEGSEAKGILCLYAASNLCFYDENGNNTLTPKPFQLNLPASASILWEESRIRSRQYRTWNGHRHNRDADRMIIRKGSVFVVQSEEPIRSERFTQGIGSHRSEGFGRIYLNPPFLQSDTALLNKSLSKGKFQQNRLAIIASAKEDELLINFLNHRERLVKEGDTLSKIVNDFIAAFKPDFKSISNSQWGQVRKYAKMAKNDAILKEILFNKEIGFCYRGQSEKHWRYNREILQDFLFNKEKMDSIASVNDLTIKLAAEMAKLP